jgi:Zn-dependent peptidase ImmA (M78 family)/transcriptional regulator with XRE-family HTH domain
MSATFNPARLLLARQSLGWTKTKLATEVQITARRLADYENRGERPPPETLALLAQALRVDESFFGAPEIAIPSNVSFRSLSTMTAGVRDMAIAASQMTIEVSKWINRAFELQQPSLPTDLAGADPVLAASVLRQAWGLGVQPAPNLVHLAEVMGVRVFALAVSARSLDAFSFWDGDTPYILINSRGTAERRRWDVAHELGHLVLHAGAHHLPSDRGREDEADQFASALLLPAEGIRRDAVQVRTLADIREHKLRWRVSAVSMIRTFYKMGYLTEWEYRNLAIEASKAKLRRFEDDIPAETSPALTMVLSELKTRKLGPKSIAAELCLRPVDVRNMFHSLVQVLIDVSDDDPATAKSHLDLARAQLRIVR